MTDSPLPAFARPAARAEWGRRLAAIRGESDFDRLAGKLFAWQFARNLPYRRLCEAAGATPATVRGWRDIPAAPQELFKRENLFCHPLAKARHLYLTSGTTTGSSGVQRLLATDLYRQAALRTVAALGPLKREMPLFFLTASPAEKPTSSLGAMFGFFKAEWGGSGLGSAFFVKGDALRLTALRRALEKAARGKRPVGLLGTAFSFVHLLDANPKWEPLRLPKGSFLLETGGFKGRSREVAKPELYRQLSRLLGIPQRDIWNEYGMTELSSQGYARGAAGEHRLPPWAKLVAVDPATGKILPPGRRGLARWIDLANVDGVLALETQDLAIRTRADGRAFRLIGRLPNLPRRGCSVPAEELRPA